MSRRSKIVVTVMGLYTLYGLLAWHMFAVVQPQSVMFFIVTALPLFEASGRMYDYLVAHSVLQVGSARTAMYPLIGLVGFVATSVVALIAQVPRLWRGKSGD